MTLATTFSERNRGELARFVEHVFLGAGFGQDEKAELARIARACHAGDRIADGSSTPKAEVEYLLGDPRRRAEGLPLLERKFNTALARVFAPKRQAAIAGLFADRQRLEAMPVHEFMDLLVV